MKLFATFWFFAFICATKPNNIKFSYSLEWSFKLSGMFSACESLLFVNFIRVFAGLTIFFNPCWTFWGIDEKSYKITITISIKNRFNNMASWLILTWIYSSGFIQHSKWVQISAYDWNRLHFPTVQYLDFWWFVKLCKCVCETLSMDAKKFENVRVFLEKHSFHPEKYTFDTFQS